MLLGDVIVYGFVLMIVLLIINLVRNDVKKSKRQKKAFQTMYEERLRKEKEEERRKQEEAKQLEIEEEERKKRLEEDHKEKERKDREEEERKRAKEKEIELAKGCIKKIEISEDIEQVVICYKIPENVKIIKSLFVEGKKGKEYMWYSKVKILEIILSERIGSYLYESFYIETKREECIIEWFFDLSNIFNLSAGEAFCEINYNTDVIKQFKEEEEMLRILEKEREEREEIAKKIKEKARRRELEKIIRQELIDRGELFGDEPKRPHIPREVVDAVYKRDSGLCVYCDSSSNLHLDHIIPFSKGGATNLENLQLLCQKCNLEKSDKIG